MQMPYQWTSRDLRWIPPMLVGCSYDRISLKNSRVVIYLFWGYVSANINSCIPLKNEVNCKSVTYFRSSFFDQATGQYLPNWLCLREDTFSLAFFWLSKLQKWLTSIVLRLLSSRFHRRLQVFVRADCARMPNIVQSKPWRDWLFDLVWPNWEAFSAINSAPVKITTANTLTWRSPRFEYCQTFPCSRFPRQESNETKHETIYPSSLRSCCSYVAQERSRFQLGKFCIP